MAKSNAKTKTKAPEAPAVETIMYTTESINKVLAYLGTRPYQEVAGIVQVMQTGQLMEQKEEA